MSERIVWEFDCACGEHKAIPADETEFSPTSIGLPTCPACGEFMRHTGPVLDTCDRCGQDLLYRGCDGLGSDTLCESCYERLEVMM